MGRKPLQDKASLRLILKMGSSPDDSESQTEEDRRMKKKRRMNEDSEDDDAMQREEEDDDVSSKSSKKEKTPLQLCLDYIHKILQKKDVNGFFSFPVTDTIAPGYSNVIERGMDLSTMRKKIDSGIYNTVKEYRDDYELMMHNCMTYNRPDTVYHREAKRLLAVGCKHISKERLNQLKRNFSWMADLAQEQIGLVAEETTTEAAAVATTKNNTDLPDGVTSRFEAIPDNMEADDILQQVQSAAKAAAEKLQAKSQKSNMGYLSKGPDGTTTLNFVTPSQSGTKVLDLGNVVGRLTHGSDELMTPKEDVRDRVTPVQYLQYGAFNSFGPTYDSSQANVDKRHSDLLLSTYAGETGLQYAKSLQEFVASSGDYVVSMVDDLLDLLTNGQHSATNALILQQEKAQLEKEKRAMEEDEEEKDDGVDECVDNDDAIASMNESKELDEALDKTSQLLLCLEQSQRQRLSGKPAANNNNNNSKLQLDELGLAQQLTTELTQLIKNVKPEDLVDVDDLRNAMNVTPDIVNVSLPLSVTPESLLAQQNAIQQQQLNNIALLQQKQQQHGNNMQQPFASIQRTTNIGMAGNCQAQLLQTTAGNIVQPPLLNNQQVSQPMLLQTQQIGQQLQQMQQQFRQIQQFQAVQPATQLPQQLDLNQLFQQQHQQQQRILLQQPQQQLNNNIRTNNALIQALQQQQIQQLQQHQLQQNQQPQLQQQVQQPQLQQPQLPKQNVFLSQPIFFNHGSPSVQQSTTSS